MTLVPAYGRDYRSKAAVHAAWNANQDFLVTDWHSPYHGKPVNKSQIPSNMTVRIRYAGPRHITLVQRAGA